MRYLILLPMLGLLMLSACTEGDSVPASTTYTVDSDDGGDGGTSY